MNSLTKEDECVSAQRGAAVNTERSWQMRSTPDVLLSLTSLLCPSMRVTVPEFRQDYHEIKGAADATRNAEENAHLQRGTLFELRLFVGPSL